MEKLMDGNMVEGTTVSEKKWKNNHNDKVESISFSSTQEHESVDSMLFSEHSISLIFLIAVAYIVIKRILSI